MPQLLGAIVVRLCVSLCVCVIRGAAVFAAKHSPSVLRVSFFFHTCVEGGSLNRRSSCFATRAYVCQYF